MDGHVSDLVNLARLIGVASNANCVMFMSGRGNEVVVIEDQVRCDKWVGLGLSFEGGCVAGEWVEVMDLAN